MSLPTDLAPGFIRLRYSGATIPHNQIIPIKFDSPATQGVEPTFETSSGGSIAMEAAIAAWLLVYRECFNAATTFGFAECYKVDATTGVRQFIWSVNSSVAGNSADPQVGLVEGVFVFKTTAGKPLKIYCMEGVFNRDVRDIGSVPADGRQDVLDYILGTGNIFYGRHDAWPLSFMSFTSKENDVLRKRALGPVI